LGHLPAIIAGCPDLKFLPLWDELPRSVVYLKLMNRTTQIMQFQSSDRLVEHGALSPKVDAHDRYFLPIQVQPIR
jgi:hypothetical protein